ncbi:glycoside hydrolase family 3 C-terminal domain-containing protein [Lachnospiraceae bacterium ZAX-1]
MEKYKDASASISERVEDLLSRMTLEQKIAQLQCMMVAGDDPSMMLGHFKNGLGEVAVFASAQSPQEVAEYNKKVVELVSENPLGIPPIIHAEAITGLNGVGATIFPSAIGLGATFNSDTVREMGIIIRGQMTSAGYRQALSPVMDVARDPRWGRIGETYGEDPTLNAQMSVAFTKGLQGDDLKTGVVVTGKHFLGYGFSDGGLNMATNPITPRELREVYAKPFQAAITEANMQSIMNSYGTIDNEVVIGSKHILTDLLRDEMKFEGIVVSDYMSIDWLVTRKVSPDIASAGIAALQAGLDVECPMPKGYAANLATVDIALIDRSVRRVLETKFKLGLFENPYPLTENLNDTYFSPEHMAHSLKTARESIVLLKNDGILPLLKETKKIAVIGPHADSIRLLFGCYTFPAGVEMGMSRSMGDMAGLDGLAGMAPEDDDFVPAELMEGCEVRKERDDVRYALQAMFGNVTPTILASVKGKFPDAQVVYAKGCEVAGTDKSLFKEALDVAQNADVVILTVGGKYGWGDTCTIGEGIDNDDIGLPGVQEELAKELFAVGTPTVIVHMDARPLASEFIKEHFPAIIENWFPGITGGTALADVLFGDYNPAGRLPVTVARNAGQIPIYAGQRVGNSYNTNGFVLARYNEGTKEPLFYFGEGKSYTEFEYSNLKIATSDDVSEISCDVKNIGKFNGEEVVQLYVSDELASMLRPYREFAGCKRVALKVGETKTVRFTVRADQFAFLDSEMRWVVEQGEMSVAIGASSNDIRIKGSFQIENAQIIAGHKRGFYAKAQVL